MPSQVDFAIATGMFVVFIAVLFLFLTGYMGRYTGLVSTSELRTAARNIFNIFFGSKGIPENWEQYKYVPSAIGLVTDLYRIPIDVTETNGTDRSSVTVRATVSFDFSCNNKSWNSTVRVLEGGDEIPSKLYNQSFCTSNYLSSSDVLFNSSFSAYQKKFFFVYFSGDRSIAPSNYSLEFSSPSGFSVQSFPEEKLSALSGSKLIALRNLTYEEVVRVLGTDYEFNVEIGEE